MEQPAPIPSPVDSYQGHVLPAWIDDNHHMNVAYYVLAFDYATDRFFDFLGLTREYKDASETSTFAVDMQVRYHRELRKGDPIRITTRLLDCSPKGLHYFHEMYHGVEGYLAATNEIVSLFMDMRVRRVGGVTGTLYERIVDVKDAHFLLPAPKDVGRPIGLRKN